MAADPFASPAWEGDARLPAPPAPAATSQPWKSAGARSSADEKGGDAAPYAAGTYAAARPGLKARFDAVVPPDRRYLGRSRRTLLLGVLGVVVLVLVLVLGLGLGLGLRKNGDAFVSLVSITRRPS